MLSASTPGPGLLRIPGGGRCAQRCRVDLVSARPCRPGRSWRRLMLPATSAQVWAFTTSAWADSGSLRIRADAAAAAGTISVSSPATASAAAHRPAAVLRRTSMGSRSAFHTPLTVTLTPVGRKTPDGPVAVHWPTAPRSDLWRKVRLRAGPAVVARQPPGRLGSSATRSSSSSRVPVSRSRSAGGRAGRASAARSPWWMSASTAKNTWSRPA